MRQRLPILLVCSMIPFALLAAGCGDDDATTTPAPDATTQEAPSSATGDVSADESAQRALANCVQAADRLPDETAAADAKQRCQDSYDNIKEGAKNLDEKTAEARENCKRAAEGIPDGEAKQNALAACDRFQ